MRNYGKYRNVWGIAVRKLTRVLAGGYLGYSGNRNSNGRHHNVHTGIVDDKIINNSNNKTLF